MSNYIEIRNTNGIVTINDDYKNLSFVKKQNGNEIINSYHFIEIDSRIGVAAIAVSSPNVKICREDQCRVRVKNGDGNLVGQVLEVASGIEEKNSINVYYFDYANKADGTVGIIVYNSKGEVVYNSNLKYLKILDIVTTAGTYHYPNKIAVFYHGNWHKDWSGIKGYLRFPSEYSFELDLDPNVPVVVADIDGL